MKRIVGGAFRYGLSAAILFGFLAAVNYFLNSNTVSQSAAADGSVTPYNLGIENLGNECSQGHGGFGPAFYDHPQISEEMIPDHFIYALAAAETYENAAYQKFRYAQFDAISRRQATTSVYSGFEELPLAFDAPLPTGLGIKVFVRASIPEQVDVIVAFRGTQMTNVTDWISNFSWFLGAFPVSTHYDSARLAMAQIMQRLTAQYPSAKFRYVTTGHSLGGGLAQHIADGFPCVSSVVFNTSFVTNSYVYQTQYPTRRISSIYEDRDILTFVRNTIGLQQTDTDDYRWYLLWLRPCQERTNSLLCRLDDHAMLPIVVGMARFTAACQVDPKEKTGCFTKVTKDPSLRDFYCSTEFAGRGRNYSDALVCDESWARQDEYRVDQTAPNSGI
ncbi:hypothetical protein ABVB72_10180 [Rhizobium nepotum]|uniref:lipase family protein n=1 Tax=Rhizobium nepotum TaxID=1035271 RepID=UPI00336AC257